MGELNLLQDFAIIMGAALAATLPLRLLRQPPVLGYLVAGLVIGPFVLPQLSVTDVETIDRLAEIGLVLLLFAIGLEFGWQRIRSVGVRVVLIGAVETTIVLAVVYQVGLGVLGLTRIEALFLGAALSISSSAVLTKMLADTGQLRTTRGQLIVGVLVVEDFIAVILLSILSGVAASGSADLGEARAIAVRLTLFTCAALLFGALLAPRLVGLVARVRSAEALLITGLFLAFGLALLGAQFGLEPAAGAFLMGAVLGDTRHSVSLNRVMTPVRDMFAALFFVSIGMLVDASEIWHVLGPALVIGLVVLLAKVVANALATFFTGSSARTSLEVGLGMPQPGEFSLAMARVGSDGGTVGATLNPIVIVTMGVMSAIYPIVFRSADVVSRVLTRLSPRLLRYYVASLGVWLPAMRRSLAMPGLATAEIRRSAKLLLVNLGVITVLIATGTVTLAFTSRLAAATPLTERVLGVVVSGLTLALCVPPGAVMWRQMAELSSSLTDYLFRRASVSPHLWRADELRRLIRLSLAIVLIAVLTVWMLPFVFRLLALGGISGVLPVTLLALALLVSAAGAFRIHAVLEGTFSRAILGSDEGGEVSEDRGEGLESGPERE